MAEAADFETCLIQPGLLAPPPVCLALATAHGAELVPSSNGWQYMRRALARLFSGPEIVGFNFPFDLGVVLEWFPELIDSVFAALSEDRVFDLRVAERLDEIATGRPAMHDSLATMSARYGLGEMIKDGGPRLTYARLLGEELTRYTPEEIAYPKLDATRTLALWHKVRARSRDRVTRAAIASETRHATWLHLCAAWGVRTAPESIEELRRAAHEAVADLREQAMASGFVRPDGSTDTKRVQEKVRGAYTGHPPLSKTGIALQRKGAPTLDKHISRSKNTLEDSGDPELEMFAEYGQWSAVINKDLDMLARGTTDPIHTRYDIANTTRTTSAGPNLQNLRRLAGIRECFVPRDGCCFGSIDVVGLELGTQAQVDIWKLGAWDMANAINRGEDLHLRAACRLKGWRYEDADKTDKEVKKWRQFCKIANFGYPGFMGAATLVPYARAQDVRIDLAQAIDLKKNWEATLPQCVARLRWIGRALRMPGERDRYAHIIPGSADILRSNVTISACANGLFQGLGAQAMKEAGWDLMKESWTDHASALYKVKMVLFVHDEFNFEIRNGEQDRVMRRADQVVVAALKRKMPDLSMRCEYAAMDRLSKDAKTITSEKGELQIWNG